MIGGLAGEKSRWTGIVADLTVQATLVTGDCLVAAGAISYAGSFKQSEPNLLRGLELAIQFGKWVLLENVGEQLDPALEPILLQQKIKQGSGYIIKLGDKSISYSDTFKLYLTTTLPNPHYSPETQVKISLLNFAITQFGLEEQMLNQLIKLEFPDLQAEKD